MITDTDRINFLESLLLRKMKVTTKEFLLDSEMHINGESGCIIYARSGVGSMIDFDGAGNSVREAIDDAIDSYKKFLNL